MTNETETLTDAEIVALGRAATVGGGYADRWLRLEAFAAASDLDSILEQSSLFTGRKPAPIAGAVYRAKVRIVEGRITSLGTVAFDRPAGGDLAQAVKLHAEGVAERERREKAEAKLKRAPELPRAIAELATIVNKLPVGQHGTAIDGIAAMIRRESLEQWRKAR